MRKQLGLPMVVIVAGALAGLVCPASAETPSAAGAWRTIDDKTGLPRSTSSSRNRTAFIGAS